MNTKLAPTTSSASDAELAENMRIDPGLLATAQRAAGAARDQAALHFDLRTRVNSTWEHLAAKSKKTHNAVAQLRIALMARDAMQAFQTLSHQNRVALSANPSYGMAVHLMNGNEMAAKVAENVAAAWASHPALAAVKADMESDHAALAAIMAKMSADRDAAIEAEMPAVLLQRLRAAGADPQIEDGALSYLARALVDQKDIDLLPRYVAVIADLLRQEAIEAAAATRRVRIAL